jgi:hypothetical protein
MIVVILLAILIPIVVMPFSMFLLLRSGIQTLKWEVSFILASYVAYLGYFRIHEILAPPLPISSFVYWALKILAIIGPICITAAWLHGSGLKWQHSLLLFPYVPIGVIAVWIIIRFPFAS